MFFFFYLPHLFSMRKVELKIFEYASKTEHTKNSLSVGIQLSNKEQRSESLSMEGDHSPV